MKRTRPRQREKKDKPEAEAKAKAKKKSIGTMDFILIVVFASLLTFTVKMIRTFEVYGAIPDTLCTCVFSVLGGECGVMGWIQTTKTKKQERAWAEEDSKREKETFTEAEPRAEPADWEDASEV